MAIKEQRKQQQIKDKELYKTKDLSQLIMQEQRKDELDRLYEVKEQKRVWRSVVSICLLLNISLALLAIWGYLNNVK